MPLPPLVAPVLVNMAAAAAYDGLRQRARRFVPRPAPAPLALGGGPSRPPSLVPPRAYPLMRPAVRGDRRRR